MKRCRNQFCKKILEPRKGQKKINPRREFCDARCQIKEGVLRYNYKNRENLEFLNKRRKTFRDWYQKNKERQNKHVLRYYYKNKKQHLERSYVERNKVEIWKILGRVCTDCGKRAEEVNHLKYDFPERDYYRTKDAKEKAKYIKEYCRFLEPLCMPCHRAKKKGKYKPVENLL